MSKLQIETDDVCFYTTEACNSNCIMCPMSEDTRKRGIAWTDLDWKEAIAELPLDTKHITITGGEPFLQWEELMSLMAYINTNLPSAEVLILTNGRALALKRLQAAINGLITNKYRFAIPIHASNESSHDQITQSPGSFVQSIAALRFLSGTKAKIEVRLVGHKLNLNDLSATCRMLADAPFRVNYINLIAMEITGCCARNRELLWVPYPIVYEHARAGLLYAIKAQIDVGLYNFPLCTLPRSAWPLAYDSITDWKIRYADECSRCSVKKACGGMFYSTYLLKLCKVNSIIQGV